MRLNKPFPFIITEITIETFTYIDDVINLIYPILSTKTIKKKS